jgi:hypothetical protein
MSGERELGLRVVTILHGGTHAGREHHWVGIPTVLYLPVLPVLTVTKSARYEKRPTRRVSLSSMAMGSGRRGSGRGIRYESWAPRSTPKRTLGDPAPDPPSRAVCGESTCHTLECLTLKVREKFRRSFVTDLAKFRHLFIRQPIGFVTRATGPDLAYYIHVCQLQFVLSAIGDNLVIRSPQRSSQPPWPRCVSHGRRGGVPRDRPRPASGQLAKRLVHAS